MGARPAGQLAGLRHALLRLRHPRPPAGPGVQSLL